MNPREMLQYEFERSGLPRIDRDALELTNIIKGEGGFARVHVAKLHEGLKATDVAAKVFDQTKLLDKRIIRRLGRSLEIAMIEELAASPHLCLPNGYIFDEDIILLSQLYDKNLKEYNEEMKTRFHNDPKAYGQQMMAALVHVIEGLKTLEARYIVHRDIKPGNILTNCNTQGNHIKSAVTDIELAGYDAIGGGAQTITIADAERGVLVGTPFYWHPLIFSNPELLKTSDRRLLDYYAFGKMGWELLFNLRSNNAPRDDKTSSNSIESQSATNDHAMTSDTIITTITSFRNNSTLRTHAEELELVGLEGVLMRLTDPQPERAYQDVNEIVEDMHSVQDGEGRRVLKKPAIKTSLAFSMGDSTYYRNLAKRKKMMGRIATAIAAGMLVISGVYEGLRYIGSAYRQIKTIEETQQLPTREESNILAKKIAGECKERMSAAKIESIARDETLRFPGGSVRGREGTITYQNDSFWAGEFLQDLAALYEASGDKYIAEQYFTFAKNLTITKNSSDEFTSPILGRFRGLLHAQEIGKKCDDALKQADIDTITKQKMIERPALAGRLLLSGWYDNSLGLLVSPLRDTRTRTVDGRDLYSSLELLASLPQYYTHDEFLSKKISSFGEATMVSGTLGQHLTQTVWTAINYVDALITIPEQSIKYLSHDGLVRNFTHITKRNGVWIDDPVNDDEALHREQIASLNGAAHAIRTVNSIVNNDDPRMQTYSAAFAAGADAAHKTAITHRSNMLARNIYTVLRAYDARWGLLSNPAAPAFDKENGRGPPDIAVAMHVAGTAHNLLTSNAVSEGEKNYLRTLARVARKTTLRVEHYYPRPWPSMLGSEPFKYGIIGSSCITRSFYGSTSGLIAKQLELLKK